MKGSKVILVTGSGGPECYEMLRIKHCLDIRLRRRRVCRPYAPAALYSAEIFVPSSGTVRG
jgi:hypothetical protein